MALRIEGRVSQITPIEEGQGARGPWKKRLLIVDTLEQYPRKVAFVVWNEKAEALNTLGIGQRVVVDFSIESREFNGRWYTDARAFGIKVVREEDVVGTNPVASQPQSTQTNSRVQQPIPQDTIDLNDNDNTESEYDDLLKDDFNDEIIDNDDLFNEEEDPSDDLPF